MEMFTLHQNTSSYKMVLKFMASLTGLEGFSEDALLSLLQDEKDSATLFEILPEEPKSHDISISLDGLNFLFEGIKWNI